MKLRVKDGDSYREFPFTPLTFGELDATHRVIQHVRSFARRIAEGSGAEEHFRLQWTELRHQEMSLFRSVLKKCLALQNEEIDSLPVDLAAALFWDIITLDYGEPYKKEPADLHQDPDMSATEDH